MTSLAGVPQRSYLGPILFIVFINNLPGSVGTSTGVPVQLFAADTLINKSFSIRDPQGQDIVQTAIDKGQIPGRFPGVVNSSTLRPKLGDNLLTLQRP